MPIYIKILGIGLLVTLLFGAVTFYQVRVGVYRTHYQVHGETAAGLATALASRIEDMVRNADLPAVDRELNLTIKAFPDVRYIVVQAPDGAILSHGFTFPQEAPPDLVLSQEGLCGACHAVLNPSEVPVDFFEISPGLSLSRGQLRTYRRNAGMIMEITVPIGTEELGRVRLGMGDQVIVPLIETISMSLLWSLSLCAVAGLSLALVLAYIIVKPIHSLVGATEQVRRGDFGVRASVFSEDEVGQLSKSFNQMTQALERYSEEVRKKEAVRVSLIGRIVQAQEEERAVIARELHDRLGQSLSKTLLTIESSCGGCIHKKESCATIKEDIRSLIDEVRQLAWDTRPSILDDYGLDQALRRYVEEMAKRVVFPIDYQCANQPDLPRAPNRIEITLYRIAQEAITNIIRHAQASRVSVILIHRSEEMCLIVEDNGVGFDPGAVEKGAKTPLGLIGMKERAALVGAEFALYSRLHEGTTVRVRVPLNGADYGD